jgi:hypothetical protein
MESEGGIPEFDVEMPTCLPLHGAIARGGLLLLYLMEDGHSTSALAKYNDVGDEE